MNARIIYKLSLICTLLLGSVVSFAQSKEDLQKEKDEIAKKIKYTQELLDKSKSNEKNATTQLVLLDKQIQFRSQLIKNINKEIGSIEDEIDNGLLEIEEMELYIESLKEEYKEMIYHSYKNRSSYDKVMYVFASESFEQAYKRLKVIQSYTESRQEQTDEIEQAQDDLMTKIESLEVVKKEKEGLLASKTEENENLQKDKSAKDQYLSEIKSEQKKLDKEIKKQIAEREKINKAIRAIIEAEAASSGGLALTPEGKIVSTNFEKNKGGLPWPVDRGIIIQGFGKQAHKQLAGIYTENNGIDINTDANSSVYSIFDGTVTSVFDIPGAGRNVIVTHGSYKTIYSNLKEVSVKKGDKISARGKVGKVLTINGENVLHFEIWKVSGSGSDPINPTYWISN